MREIKFRFWSPHGDGMRPDHDGWVEDIGINEALEASANYGYKIMQYTGLKDKNGKEIYEGDIVTAKTCKGDSVEFLRGSVIFEDAEYLVEQNNGRFPLCSFHVIDFTTFEVIGNIHQHPDLMEG